jgi:glycosidase
MNTWIKNYIFYHIYPLGLCGAEHKNNNNSEVITNLNKIFEWIPYLKNLGTNAIYLGPLFESSSHGYDTIDYFKVDKRLGSNDTLKNLVNEFHKNEIKVILDGVFHHTGRDFFAFADLKQNTINSHYKDWFVNINFNKKSNYNDPFSYDGWNGHYNLVKLNLNNPDVKKHIFSAIKFWIDEFKIDGLRLDAADYIDLNFLQELSDFCKKINSDFLLLGEVIHGDYRKWVNERTLDSVTNYECYKGLWSCHNDNNFFEIAYTLNRQFGENGMYKNLFLYNFADNHDVNRVMTSLKNPAHIYTLYLILFTMPGIPSIYYGSEWGIAGKKEKFNDYDLRPEIMISQLTSNTNNNNLYDSIKKFINLRKKYTSLKYGSYKQIYLSHNQLVFLREYNNEKIIIAVNSENKNIPIEFSLPFNYSKLFDVLNNEKIQVTVNKQKLDLYPNWGRIIIIS